MDADYPTKGVNIPRRSTSETTERYTHLSDQSVADAADRVSGRIHAALVGRGAEREGGARHAHR